MNIIIAILAGLAGGALGLAVGAGAGSLLAASLKITSREGAAGYFVVLIALVGGVLGFLVAAALTFRWRGTGGVGAIAGNTLLSGVAVVALVAGCIALYAFTAELPFSGGSPRLTYEIKLPEGVATPDNVNTYSLELHTPKYRPAGYISSDEKRLDGGRAVLTGEVELSSKTSSRLLVLTVPGGDQKLYRVRIPRDPTWGFGDHKQWSAWSKPDHVYKPGDENPSKGASGDVEIRYKIRMLGED